MQKEKTTVVLEESTNTHVLESENEIKMQKIGPSTLKLKIQGKGVVLHGEHGTICTESQDVIKYVQKEYNPILKAMQNAFD
jgi:glutaredoxin 2